MARFTPETNPNPPDYPPPNVPPNIFKLLRESHEPPISLSDLAQATNLSKTTIQRTEQGLYTDPSTKLVDYYVASPHFIRHRSQYASLTESYKAYQRKVREHNGPKIVPFFDPETTFGSRPLGQHPLEFLLFHPRPREGNSRSRMQFCKAFCVPPDVVNRWVNRPDLVARTPSSIEAALRVAGYPEEFLERLNAQFLSHKAAIAHAK